MIVLISTNNLALITRFGRILHLRLKPFSFTISSLISSHIIHIVLTFLEYILILQMKRKLFVQGRGTNSNSPLKTRLKGVGCPYGTVPIRRVNEDDLIRAKILPNIHPSNLDDEPGYHVSFISSLIVLRINKKYYYFGQLIYVNYHVRSMQYFKQKLIPIEGLMELNHTFAYLTLEESLDPSTVPSGWHYQTVLTA
jgi:hypothetical protein